MSNRKKSYAWFAIILGIILIFTISARQLKWGWSGLIPYTTTIETKGNLTVETHPGKTFWDFLELIIIPAALGLGAFFLNKSQSQTEQLIASNQQQEIILQSYIDAMTTLVLEKNLRQTTEEHAEDVDLRNVARSRTLTVLRALDTPNKDGNNRRRASLIRFLVETQLIIGENPAVNLDKANLEVAYMRGQNLRNANLKGVSLYKADLRDTDLRGANLEGAYLVKTKLQGAILIDANLNGATLKQACYGKYVNTETRWPEGFNVLNKGLIRQDIDSSRDWSKNIL